MPQFSNFLENSTIHFHMFTYLVTCFLSHDFVAVPVTRSNNFVSLHQLDRDKLGHVSLIQHVTGYSHETATLRKHVTKYKNMQKRMVEYLEQFENRGIKISRDNTNLITKSINLQLSTLILYGVGVRCDRRQFSVLMSIYREAYVSIY